MKKLPVIIALLALISLHLALAGSYTNSSHVANTHVTGGYANYLLGNNQHIENIDTPDNETQPDTGISSSIYLSWSFFSIETEAAPSAEADAYTLIRYPYDRLWDLHIEGIISTTDYGTNDAGSIDFLICDEDGTCIEIASNSTDDVTYANYPWDITFHYDETNTSNSIAEFNGVNTTINSAYITNFDKPAYFKILWYSSGRTNFLTEGYITNITFFREEDSIPLALIIPEIEDNYTTTNFTISNGALSSTITYGLFAALTEIDETIGTIRWNGHTVEHKNTETELKREYIDITPVDDNCYLEGSLYGDGGALEGKLVEVWSDTNDAGQYLYWGAKYTDTSGYVSIPLTHDYHYKYIIHYSDTSNITKYYTANCYDDTERNYYDPEADTYYGGALNNWTNCSTIISETTNCNLGYTSARPTDTIIIINSTDLTNGTQVNSTHIFNSTYGFNWSYTYVNGTNMTLYIHTSDEVDYYSHIYKAPPNLALTGEIKATFKEHPILFLILILIGAAVMAVIIEERQEGWGNYTFMGVLAIAGAFMPILWLIASVPFVLKVAVPVYKKMMKGET